MGYPLGAGFSNSSFLVSGPSTTTLRLPCSLSTLDSVITLLLSPTLVCSVSPQACWRSHCFCATCQVLCNDTRLDRFTERRVLVGWAGRLSEARSSLCTALTQGERCRGQTMRLKASFDTLKALSDSDSDRRVQPLLGAFTREDVSSPFRLGRYRRNESVQRAAGGIAVTDQQWLSCLVERLGAHAGSCWWLAGCIV